MIKSERKKPVFHEATNAPKPEFEPHQFGMEEKKPATEDLELSPEQNEDLDVLLSESGPSVEETGLESASEQNTSETAASSPEIVLFNGWRAISDAQKTGKTYQVTNNLENTGGEMAFWRKTRALSNFKWVARGFWASSLTRVTLVPQPSYYKEV